MLDLHHLGAEAGQELGGIGESRHLLGGEDTDPLERARVGRILRVGDISEAHGLSLDPTAAGSHTGHEAGDCAVY